MVTRDELDVYDLLKTMSFFMIMASLFIGMIGKLGMKTVWKEKSWATKWIGMKSLMLLILTLACGLVLKGDSHEFHKITRRHKPNKHHEKHNDNIIEF